MKIKRLPKYKISSENIKILSEIGELLERYIGNTITFCDFTAILDRDNCLCFYKRDSLLHWRKKFFRKEIKSGEKDGRKTPKRIEMKSEDFLKFLGHLSSNGKVDLQKFKKTVIHCMNTGYLLSGKKIVDFQSTIYKTY